MSQPLVLPRALACFALAASHLLAQGTQGSLSGTVFDASGSVLPDALVRLTSEGTSQRWEARTGATGNFNFPALLPGRYTLEAERTGFKTVRNSGIVLQVAQSATVDLRLEVGSLAERVEVTAAAPVLNRESAAVGQAIENKQILDMPLNGRNFLQLGLLVPGASENPGAQSQFSINGMRGNMTSTLLDGMEVRAVRNGRPALQPSVDALQEFRIQQNAFSAEFATGTAVINVAFKSGTNGFHGTAYEFLRNDKLDARNVFDRTPTLPPFRRNQFGFAAGGPVIKNKLFFFANYEGLRTRRSRTVFANVPTPAQLSGDFTGSPLIHDPFVVNNGQRQPFPGNRIPASQVSQYARAAAKLYPTPNLTGVPGQNFVTQRPNPDDADQGNLRMDSVLSEKHNLFARFSESRANNETLTALPYTGNLNTNNGRNATLSHTWLVSPATINQFRVGYTAVDVFVGNPLAETPLAITEFGLRNLNIPGNAQGSPQLNIVGITTMGSGPFTPQGSIENLYEVGNDITLQRGRHAFKAGFVGRRFRPALRALLTPNGILNFENRFSNQIGVPGTGTPIADFVLGYPLSARAGIPIQTNGFVDLVYNNYGFYIQDDFKLSPKLTLNLGLRYEYQNPIRERYNSARSWSVAEQRFLEVGKDIPSLTAPDRNNFAPRVGVAYSLNPKTVVRAGAGLFYGFIRGDEYPVYQLNPPFSNDSTINSDPLRPTLLPGVLFPAPSSQLQPGTNVFSIDYNLPASQTWQWNVTIQRELLANLALEVAYVGSKSSYLTARSLPNQATLDVDPTRPTSIQSRRPNPLIGDVSLTGALDPANYNALQAKLERRYAAGLSLLGAFTYSKALGISEAGDQSTVMDTRDRQRDYGPLPYDQRFRFTMSFAYELPFGKGKAMLNSLPGWANVALGGWQLGGIVTMRVGEARSPAGNVSANVGRSDRNRPNRIGNGNLPRGDRGVNRWFDTAAFRPQAFGTFGNSGEGVLRMPGANNWDLSLLKNFRVTETSSLQFRSEFFSAFNHPLYGYPGLTIGTPQFGVITTASGSRSIQMALKFIW